MSYACAKINEEGLRCSCVPRVIDAHCCITPGVDILATRHD
jgi:hypothetical protein